MKKLFMFIMALAVCAVPLIADEPVQSPTCLPNGLVAGSQDRVIQDTYTPVCSNDMFVEGDLQVGRRGQVNIKKLVVYPQSWAKPLAISSVGVLACNISTSTLDGKTTTWAEHFMSTYTYARTLGASYSMTALASNNGVVQSSNVVFGNITFNGYDAKGSTITETIVSTMSGTINYTSNAFARLTSVVVGIPTWRGTDNQAVWTGITLNLATGEKLGLCADILSSDDLLSVVEVGCGVRTDKVTVDADYDTIDFYYTLAGTAKEILFLGASHYQSH